MASLLIDCWEGAALHSRLRSNAAPLGAMLDFYFTSAIGQPLYKQARLQKASVRGRRAR
jgi:hypothetical protein